MAPLDSGTELDETIDDQPAPTQPAPTPPSQSTQPTQPTQSTKPTRPKKGKTMNVDQDTETLLSSLDEQTRHTRQLQTQISGMLHQSPPSAPTLWGNWIGTIAETLHPQLLPKFYQDSFNMMMGLVAQTTQINAMQPPHLPPQQQPQPPPQQQQQQPPQQQYTPPPPTLQMHPPPQLQPMEVCSTEFVAHQAQQLQFWQGQRPQTAPPAATTSADVITWGGDTPQPTSGRPSSTPSNFSLSDISFSHLLQTPDDTAPKDTA